MKCNLSEIHTIEEYTFVNFTQLDEHDVQNIRVWRNDPSVRTFMYNSDEITEEAHLNFISSLSHRKDKIYWLVYSNNAPLGVVSVVDIDYLKSLGEIGYYLVPQEQNSGKGLDFLYAAYYFLFDTIGFNELFGRTEIHNINAIALNHYLGAVASDRIVDIDGIKYVEFSFNKHDFLESYKYRSNASRLISFLKKTRPQLIQKYKDI